MARKTTSRRAVLFPALLFAGLPLVFGCLPSADPRPRGGRDSAVKGVAAVPYRTDPVSHEAYLMVNEERIRRGLAPLARRPELDAVAMAHARDNHYMNRLSHTSSDGRKLEHRMGRLNWMRAGENLARNKGFESPPAEAVRGWIASPRHYENMFRADFIQTGMAALYDPETGFTYFVQVFVVPA